MKRFLIFFSAVMILAALTACAGGVPAGTPDNGTAAVTGGSSAGETAAADIGDTEAPDTGENAPDDRQTGADSDNDSVLVVFFSATGTTKGVAEKIAAIENADLYEIKAKQEYTSADLNWNDSGSRSTKEQNDKSVRPEIGGESVSLEGYDKIYIGFPIWWGEEPRIMDTFVESHSFDGVTVIPFCTSASSGIGRSGQNLADNAKSGSWLDGKRFAGNVSESELRSWIESLG